MTSNLKKSLINLKEELLALEPTKLTGFEGILGEALQEITGVPFRLAGSGLQGGIDGKAMYEADHICFEGKRYDGPIHRNDLITKIADLGRNPYLPDMVWILGATTGVKTQDADSVRKDGEIKGISVIIWDWTGANSTIPSLAAALAMGGQRIEDFFKRQIKDSTRLTNLLASLKSIRNEPDFHSHESRIRNELSGPSIGTMLALQANTKWLQTILSDRRLAIRNLGQPLCPNDLTRGKVLDREVVTAQIKTHLTDNQVNKIIFVLGNEGCGKSWAVAKSWLEIVPKLLMVVVKPEELDDLFSVNNFEDFLLSKILEQTRDKNTQENKNRWQRRLLAWKSNDLKQSPLVIFIDGINQKPTVEWAKVINKISLVVETLKSRLVITSRIGFFKDRVKPLLNADYITVSVNEWTTPERDQILEDHGININVINPKVAQNLLNPRLLGVALSIFKKNDIDSFEELNISRLFFEYIRLSDENASLQISARDFASHLQSLAKEMLHRAAIKELEDLNVFNIEAAAVAEGHFFERLVGNSGQYQLKDEGVTLALGFGLVELLLKAERNNRSLLDTLTSLLEPISALDDTGNVVIAGLTIAIHDAQEYSDEIAYSLIEGLVSLQNLDETQYPGFVGLVKQKPEVFLHAANSLFISGLYYPSIDWVQASLIEVSSDPFIWKLMTVWIQRWLSTYKPKPNQIISNLSEDSLKQETENIARKEEAIRNKLSNLSPIEKTILNRSQRIEDAITPLISLCTFLMAGKPLTHFADSLVDWFFGYAINPEDYLAFRHINHLISLNRSDWKEARAALLTASDTLNLPEVSSTGKWALVYILQSSGASNDAKEAKIISTTIRNNSSFERWRIVEDYCATDPCDPDSGKPENIDITCQKYAHVDISNLYKFMGQTTEGHFMSDTRPGMARFHLDVVIAKLREFADDVLSRKGIPLRQGIFELHNHNALLTTAHAEKLVNRWSTVKSNDFLDEMARDDRRFILQYHLIIAFPFLTADERMSIFLSIEDWENIPVALMELLLPVEEEKLNDLFDKSNINGDENKLFLLMVVAKSTRAKLTDKTQNFIMSLITSPSERIRSQAMGLMLETSSKLMLNHLVQSDWSFEKALTDNGYEEWYGSLALLEAAKINLIDHQDVVNRISSRVYGRALTIVNDDAKLEISKRVDACIKQLIKVDALALEPEVGIEIGQNNSNEPDRFRVSEKPLDQRDIQGAFGRISESNEDFQARQKLNIKAFEAFRQKLDRTQSSFILRNFKLEEFAVLANVNKLQTEDWFNDLLKMNSSKLSFLHNIIVLLAYSLSDSEPDKAVSLYNRVNKNKPFVKYTFGYPDIELGLFAQWAGKEHSVLNELRYKRLDKAKNDNDYAVEVVAAIMCGKSGLLETYVKTKLASIEPAEVARGIMVAGFSDENDFNTGALQQHQHSKGLPGLAYKAAMYAYERNKWARHWYGKMCSADTNETYWGFSVLFNKIVDIRFLYWHDQYVQSSKPIKDFSHVGDSRIQNRFKRWESLREKKLFGSDVPSAIFLMDS